MNSRAILGVSLAVVFALSMIMAPAFAGGHLALEKAQMTKHQEKGEIDLKIKVMAKIPKNEQSSFGYALLGWEKVLVLTTHVPLFDDSDFDKKKGAFHTHVLSLTTSTPCSTGLAVDLTKDITDPGYKNKVGKEKIKIKKVVLADLGPKIGPIDVAAFKLLFEGGNLCVDVKSGLPVEIKLKK